MIYLIYKRKIPFTGREGFFGPENSFKVKHVMNPNHWLEKEGNGFNTEFIFLELLARLWGVYGR